MILGDDELAHGKVRVKELGLREGHPEKDGVLVAMNELVKEVKERLRRKQEQGQDTDADVASGGDLEKSRSGSDKGGLQDGGVTEDRNLPSNMTEQETLPIRDRL